MSLLSLILWGATLGVGISVDSPCGHLPLHRVLEGKQIVLHAVADRPVTGVSWGLATIKPNQTSLVCKSSSAFNITACEKFIHRLTNCSRTLAIRGAARDDSGCYKVRLRYGKGFGAVFWFNVRVISMRPLVVPENMIEGGKKVRCLDGNNADSKGTLYFKKIDGWQEHYWHSPSEDGAVGDFSMPVTWFGICLDVMCCVKNGPLEGCTGWIRMKGGSYWDHRYEITPRWYCTWRDIPHDFSKGKRDICLSHKNNEHGTGCLGESFAISTRKNVDLWTRHNFPCKNSHPVALGGKNKECKVPEILRCDHELKIETLTYAHGVGHFADRVEELVTAYTVAVESPPKAELSLKHAVIKHLIFECSHDSSSKDVTVEWKIAGNYWSAVVDKHNPAVLTLEPECWQTVNRLNYFIKLQCIVKTKQWHSYSSVFNAWGDPYLAGLYYLPVYWCPEGRRLGLGS